MKLSLEEKDELAGMAEHPGWKALIKEMDATIQSFEARMLKLDSETTQDRVLLVTKARLEGAKQMRDALIIRVNQLKVKHDA